MNKQDPGIQYLDYTCNPIKMRCTPVDIACKYCWHIEQCDMFLKNPLICGSKSGMGLSAKQVHNRKIYGGECVYLNEKELQAPLKLKKPSVIGVQFMGDLFHDVIMIRDIRRVFGMMAHSPQHVFLVLTKRVERMARLIPEIRSHYPDRLDHVWLGVSVHDQKSADERIPILLQIPAAKRWVSYEPELGEVDFGKGFLRETDPEYGEVWEPYIDHLDYIVAGHESGRNARHGDIAHLESVARQCEAAGVPLMVKQAWIDGKFVKMPKILGKVWDTRPELTK